MFPSRNPQPPPPTWVGVTPFWWKLVLAGGVLAVIVIAAVL